MSTIASEHFAEVVGIDPLLRLYTGWFRGQERDGVTIRKVGLHEFESAEPFDAILFWGSFYLIAPYRRTIDAAVSLLAPGGVIIITDDLHRDADRTETPRSLCYSVSELSRHAGLVEQDHLVLNDYLRVSFLMRRPSSTR